MSLTKLVRRQFEKMGLNLSWRRADNGPPLPLLRLLAEHCVLTEGKGAVIQVGANDGLMRDPVHGIIVELGLPALLVEPLPDLFARLKANYAGVPNIAFENTAVGAKGGDAEIYRIGAAAHVPDWAQGLASFEKRVLLRHRRALRAADKDFERHIETVRVPVVTVAQLLGRHPGIGKIMLLQIDTEGHDFAVIQSAVAANCLPPIIHYEHKHLGYADQAACRELLTPYGYSFLSDETDTLAYRPPAGSPAS
ncbi:MAG TPA: FkbM family methyltransferase [Alphaproteobacteria bacterium]|nr:FkbM family methyltransferase [Alphaproteobacteria bacterium]